MASTRLSGRIPKLYVDIDGLAEAMDCMRAGNISRTADILMTRFQALEVSIHGAPGAGSGVMGRDV